MFVTPSLAASSYDCHHRISQKSYGGCWGVSAEDFAYNYRTAAGGADSANSDKSGCAKTAKISTKESVKKRILAKIVKILTLKDTSKTKKHRSKFGGASRWRRVSAAITFPTPRASLSSLSLNFEPVLPTILEETESEMSALT